MTSSISLPVLASNELIDVPVSISSNSVQTAQQSLQIVMSHMWLKLEQMRETDKWEADMLAQQDQDLLWGEVLEELGLQ